MVITQPITFVQGDKTSDYETADSRRDNPGILPMLEHRCANPLGMFCLRSPSLQPIEDQGQGTCLKALIL